MEPREYNVLAAAEQRHPWFLNRRRLVRLLISRLASHRPWPLILDAGCGTGVNLVDYARIGRVCGLEPEATAARTSRQRSGQPVVRGDLCRLPFLDGCFDLVVSTDVLEHVEDDEGALRELARVLCPGGRMVLTVPAWPWAYTRHDRQLGHIRRYSFWRLRRACRRAGLTILHQSRYNVLASVPLLAVRWLAPYRSSSDVGRPVPGWLAVLLNAVFGLEAHLAARLDLKCGLTHVVVLQRPEREGGTCRL